MWFQWTLTISFILFLSCGDGVETTTKGKSTKKKSKIVTPKQNKPPFKPNQKKPKPNPSQNLSNTSGKEPINNNEQPSQENEETDGTPSQPENSNTPSTPKPPTTPNQQTSPPIQVNNNTFNQKDISQFQSELENARKNPKNINIKDMSVKQKTAVPREDKTDYTNPKYYGNHKTLGSWGNNAEIKSALTTGWLKWILNSKENVSVGDLHDYLKLGPKESSLAIPPGDKQKGPAIHVWGALTFLHKEFGTHQKAFDRLKRFDDITPEKNKTKQFSTIANTELGKGIKKLVSSVKSLPKPEQVSVDNYERMNNDIKKELASIAKQLKVLDTKTVRLGKNNTQLQNQQKLAEQAARKRQQEAAERKRKAEKLKKQRKKQEKQRKETINKINVFSAKMSDLATTLPGLRIQYYDYMKKLKSELEWAKIRRNRENITPMDEIEFNRQLDGARFNKANELLKQHKIEQKYNEIARLYEDIEKINGVYVDENNKQISEETTRALNKFKDARTSEKQMREFYVDLLSGTWDTPEPKDNVYRRLHAF